MDTLTHGILGALTVRSLPDRYSNLTSRELTIVAILGATFPDIDYFLFWVHPLKFLAEWHRAGTHSFILMPIWSILIGFIVALLMKARWKWRSYSIVSAIAMSTHIVTDMITVYGTQVLSPLSDFRAVIGTTFLIDGYFTGIVLFGLIGSIVLKKYLNCFDKKFAVLVLCVLLSYLGLQGYFRSLANDVAQRYAAQHGLQNAVIHKLPQPFSPTYWKIIIDGDSSYHVAFIDVIPLSWHKRLTQATVNVISGHSDTMEKAVQSYLPAETAVWHRYPKINKSDSDVLIAWNQDVLSTFRHFALLPILYRKDNDSSGKCMWFTDLRYVFPVISPPFRFGVCDVQGQWILYRLERHTLNNRQVVDWPF